MTKHKKPFISAPERARTVLNAFLGCMYLAETDRCFSLDGDYSFSKIPVFFEIFDIFQKFRYIFDRGFQLQLFSGGIFGRYFW